MTVSECEAQRGVTNEVCGLGIQPENRPLSPPVRDLHREGEAVTAAGLGTPRWAGDSPLGVYQEPEDHGACRVGTEMGAGPL